MFPRQTKRTETGCGVGGVESLIVVLMCAFFWERDVEIVS